jgi:amino acid permease
MTLANLHSLNGMACTFVIAETRYADREMIGIMAGKSANPRQAIPWAIAQVSGGWQIQIFCIGMMFFIPF